MAADEEVLPAVSTSSLAFQAVLDDLVRAVDAPELAPNELAESPRCSSLPENAPIRDTYEHFDEHRGARTPAGAPPARLRGRGDLTLVVGLGADADAAAAALAASAGADAEVRHVRDRRAALAARADGVRRGIPVVAVFPLAGPTDVHAVVPQLAAIAPDQVWVAVDVSRKHDDTAEWVRTVDAALAVDAVAATGASLTASPGSVQAFGLPVLWLETPPGG
jgi:hypothetical protein